MTWTNNLRSRLKQQYNITPKISSTLKKRYGKNHRASFWFDNLNTEIGEFNRYIYHRKDVNKSYKLRTCLKKLKSGAKIRHEWSDDFVYFDDLDEFLSCLPKDMLRDLTALEIMDPELVEAQSQETDDYQSEIAFCKKIPFDKYRYQVYIVTSANERNNIGHDNLLHLRLSIEAYDGIRVNDTFRKSHKHRWWVPETYFYAETLDWLPLIRLMEPRYIKKIKQYKTLEEIKNENST